MYIEDVYRLNIYKVLERCDIKMFINFFIICVFNYCNLVLGSFSVLVIVGIVNFFLVIIINLFRVFLVRLMGVYVKWIRV